MDISKKEQLAILREVAQDTETDNERKVQMAALRICFLMEHQTFYKEQLEEMQIEALNLSPRTSVNKNSPEYLTGAMDALHTLLNMLEGKSPPIDE